MIFSIDVEDWAQSVLDRSNPVSNRVYDNTSQILDLLAQYGHQATFFVLANVAEKHPELIRKIVDAGHEVGSHGCNHINLYTMSPEEVNDDVQRSVKTLEDVTGKKVIGYRAPNFSIRENMFEWYCAALAENGLKYDSSLFPMKVIKYGIERKYPLDVFHKYGINEHYLSYINVGKYKLPFFGGGYFRLAPYAVTKYFTKQFNEENSGVFYMHPFEIDTGEFAEVKRLYKKIPLIRNQFFVSRGTVKNKLHRLLSDFDFTSFQRRYYYNYNDFNDYKDDTLIDATRKFNNKTYANNTNKIPA